MGQKEGPGVASKERDGVLLLKPVEGITERITDSIELDDGAESCAHYMWV